jgi:hypothetical protein
VLKLSRPTSFWIQPWFVVIAIVVGEWYGAMWVSFGTPAPQYLPSTMVVASATDGFEMTITAPGIPGARIQAAN